MTVMCHNGHPFEPGIDEDEPNSPCPDWCNVCGERRRRRYLRSSNGETIHRADCRRAKNAVSWHYADDMTDEQMRWTIANHSWLRPCLVCKPGSAT